MMENCESDIFIAIPCLAILKHLLSDHQEDSLCNRFLPLIFKEGEEPHRKHLELKQEYLKLRTRVCGSTEFIIRTGSSSHQR